MRAFLVVVAALVLTGGAWYTATLRSENQALRERIAQYESAAETERPRPRPRIPGTDSGARVLTEEARDVLWAELNLEPGNRVWFVTHPNDPEADLFQREIEATFLEAGWEIAGSVHSERPLREGVRVFIADDDFADHVSAAINGLRATGLEVFAGTGYRAFYDKKKREDPDFSGVELAPDQDFVIVVGPKPSRP